MMFFKMFFKNNQKKKRRKEMCKKLKQIHDLKANDILHNYRLQRASHEYINITDVLDFLEIDYNVINFEELEKSLFLKGNDDILGMACSEGDEVRILYSDTLDAKDTNYVLAHELAHCCLHLPVSAEFHVELKVKNDIYSSFLSKPLKNNRIAKKENEADLFAADLLIPTDLFVEYLNKAESFSVKDISNHFNVPELLVHKKIAKLANRY